MTPLKYSVTFTHITSTLCTLLGAADGDETGWHPLHEGVIEHLHFQRRRYPALPVLIMLSTRIDSIRTADFTRLRFPPPPPPTWQRPSPSSDLRATLSFPQSRRDNQYAKSNPVQHGRFAVMQNGPNAGVFDSRRGYHCGQCEKRADRASVKPSRQNWEMTNLSFSFAAVRAR